MIFKLALHPLQSILYRAARENLEHSHQITSSPSTKVIQRFCTALWKKKSKLLCLIHKAIKSALLLTQSLIILYHIPSSHTNLLCSVPFNAVWFPAVCCFFKVKTVTTKIKCEIRFLSIPRHLSSTELSHGAGGHMTRTDDQEMTRTFLSLQIKLGPCCPSCPLGKVQSFLMALAWGCYLCLSPSNLFPWLDPDIGLSGRFPHKHRSKEATV